MNKLLNDEARVLSILLSLGVVMTKVFFPTAGNYP